MAIFLGLVGPDMLRCIIHYEAYSSFQTYRDLAAQVEEMATYSRHTIDNAPSYIMYMQLLREGMHAEVGARSLIATSHRSYIRKGQRLPAGERHIAPVCQIRQVRVIWNVSNGVAESMVISPA